MTGTVELADVVNAQDVDFDPESLIALAADPQAGAVVSFIGVVRNHDQGEKVRAIDYSAHPTATEVMAQLAARFAAQEGVYKVVARHRVGHLEIGDPVVVLAVSAAHRSQAFQACQGLSDQIKADLPIWKHQEFQDGSRRWTGID